VSLFLVRNMVSKAAIFGNFSFWLLHCKRYLDYKFTFMG
jgi:hypothetical protein